MKGGQGSSARWLRWMWPFEATQSPAVPNVQSHILSPLIKQLQRYAKLRIELASKGGCLADLDTITAVLNEKIIVEAGIRRHAVALTDPGAVCAMVRDVAGSGVHLQVRRTDHGWPVHYLCRIHCDTWREYGLIVEDLYCDSSYPLAEGRFTRLMVGGREVYFLRLSPFRRAVVDKFLEGCMDRAALADEILCQVGRHVLQLAWHEDQLSALIVSMHFGLPWLRHAMEILYLCLSGDLCELRSAVDERMRQFFWDVYPQPCIHRLLSVLPDLDGDALNRIPRQALGLYPVLSRAFGEFLAVEAPWGEGKALVPLFKIVFANLSRMEAIVAQLAINAAVADAMFDLEKQARVVADAVLDAAGSK